MRLRQSHAYDSHGSTRRLVGRTVTRAVSLLDPCHFVISAASVPARGGQVGSGLVFPWIAAMTDGSDIAKHVEEQHRCI